MINRDDEFNEAFASQLAELQPASSESSMEKMLYEAGYQAGQETRSRVSGFSVGKFELVLYGKPLTHTGGANAQTVEENTSSELTTRPSQSKRADGAVESSPKSKRSMGRWTPAIAASLLTAIVTLPLAYHRGTLQQHHSGESVAQQSQRGDDVDWDPDSRSDPPDDIDRPVKLLVAPDHRNPLNERFATGLSQFGLSWPVATAPPIVTTGPPTVYHSWMTNPLPESTWLVMDDEPHSQQETLSIRDFTTASATLGL